jgi:hypothetical protein
MVMEASPPAPFIIAEAEFLLQLLVVALDPPSQLGDIDQTRKADLLGSVASQYLGFVPTLCWRETDSNFQYAGAGNLFVAPFVVPGCLGGYQDIDPAPFPKPNGLVELA